MISTKVISEIWLIYSNLFLAIWISQISLIISRFWLIQIYRSGKIFIPKTCTLGFLRMLITNLNLKFRNSKRRIQYRVPRSIQIRLFFALSSVILDPPFLIFEFCVQIRNKRPRKSQSTNFYLNQVKFAISVRHFEFSNLEFKFVMSDLKNRGVQIFI